MYKMDKTIGKLTTHNELEKTKLFSPETTYGQRLAEAWYLTCMAYGIDYKNPPKMDKTFGGSRKSKL
jgi:hypothetical protein